MSVKRTIVRNVVSNWTGYAVSVVVALFLSPFVVHTLGDDLYGLWTLIIAFTGYYGLMDLGIRSAVGQYVTRYWAQNDIDGVNRTMNTAVVLMSSVAVLAILATAVIAVGLPRWFNIQGETPCRVQLAVAIMGLGIALNLPMAVYGSATLARQRFDLSNLIGIMERLASAGLIVWALRSGQGLLGLAVVSTAVNLLGAWGRIWVAYRLLPGLAFSPRRFSRSSVSELAHYGVFSLAIRLAGQITASAGAVIIGLFMTTAAVTYYAIGANLIPYYVGIIGAITLTFTPYATAADARRDHAALRRLLLTGTRFSLLAAAMIGGGLIFLGHDFLGLWMGEKYLLGSPYASSADVLIVLACATLVRMSQSCGKQILFGMGAVKFLAVLQSLEGAACLGLSLLLVTRFGILGVALGFLVPVLVTTGIAHPLYLLRKLEVPLRSYLREVLPAAATLLATMAILSWLAGPHLAAASWAGFFVKALTLSAPAGIVGALAGTTRKERADLVAWVRAREHA